MAHDIGREKQSSKTYDLSLLEIEITNKCSVGCPICYIGNERNTVEMSPEVVYRLITEAVGLGVEYLIFTGGEPLCYPNLIRVLEMASEEGLKIGLLTSGHSLDIAFARQHLKDRVRFVQLSLHDLPEKNALSRKAVELAPLLQEEGIQATILITLSQLNLSYAEKLMQICEDLEVPYGLQRYVSPVKGPKGYRLDREQWDVFLRKVSQMLPERPLINCEDPLLNRYLDLELVMHFPEGYRLGCPAGKTAALISADGKLFPCAKLRVSDCNIAQVSLAEAWNTSPLFNQLRQPPANSPCRYCSIFFVCGGCRADAYQSTKDIWGGDPLCPGPIDLSSPLQQQ